MVVTKDLPSNILLASFPIIKEDKNSLEFDFNAGMKNVFSASSLHTSDFQGGKLTFPNMNLPR